MNITLTIQEKLKDLRIEKGLTLEQLAEQTGISKSAFKRALGHLLKAGLISEDKEAGTITLIHDPESDNDE